MRYPVVVLQARYFLCGILSFQIHELQYGCNNQICLEIELKHEFLLTTFTIHAKNVLMLGNLFILQTS
jgi:hypothetical protein